MVEAEQFSRLESALRDSAEELIAGRGGEVGGDEPWEQALVRLSAAAATSVPGASYVGMTMRTREGGLRSRAPSHESIVELDRAQADLGEGPCVEALAPDSARIIRVDDFADEPRWPSFAATAVDAGIASLLSYALAPHGATPGAMNFYGTGKEAFSVPAARALAGAFAMQAAVAIYGVGRVEKLTEALGSRDVIGQAKGILMERHGLDDQQAFDLLVRSSQDTNIKLVDVARWLAGEVAGRTSGTRRAGRPAQRR